MALVAENGNARPLRAVFLGRHGHGHEPEAVRIESAYEARTFPDGDILWQAVDGWFANGGGPCHVAPLGADDDPLFALDTTLRMLEHLPLDVVCFPGLVDHVQTASGETDLDAFGAAQRMIVEACIASGDRLAVLDPPPGLAPEQMRDWRFDVLGADTPHAVLYYPWLQVVAGGHLVWVPPCGHVAGAWARVTQASGVLAPVGNLELTDALDVEVNLTAGEQDMLAGLGVNPVRAMPSWGVRTWGARTLSVSPWLFQIPTARLLAALKPVVVERLRRFAGTADVGLVTQTESAIRSVSGLPPEAFDVRFLNDAHRPMRVEIDLHENVTHGYPMTIVIELPAGTWTVVETEPARDSQPPHLRG
jgi:hypothetical protein